LGVDALLTVWDVFGEGLNGLDWIDFGSSLAVFLGLVCG
jgi:hypothetical protein